MKKSSTFAIANKKLQLRVKAAARHNSRESRFCSRLALPLQCKQGNMIWRLFRQPGNEKARVQTPNPLT